MTQFAILQITHFITLEIIYRPDPGPLSFKYKKKLEISRTYEKPEPTFVLKMVPWNAWQKPAAISPELASVLIL